MKEEEITNYLVEVMKAHGVDVTRENEWIVPNGKLPAIRCNWYAAPEGKSGRFDVQVMISQDQLIEECFAGIGEGKIGFENGFENFLVNSFHVLLSAFWDTHDSDQVLIEQWKIGNFDYTVYLGNFGTKGANGVHPGIPDETFSKIEDALKSTKIPTPISWTRIFYCNVDGKDKVYEALLNNEPWRAGEEALRTINWAESNNYYSVRNFLVLSKNT